MRLTCRGLSSSATSTRGRSAEDVAGVCHNAGGLSFLLLREVSMACFWDDGEYMAGGKERRRERKDGRAEGQKHEASGN